jgi:rhodanese-related sulfurtransferase
MIAKVGSTIWRVIIILTFWAMGIHLAVAAEKVPRITDEELKSMLGKPELVLLDVRTPSDWETSQAKIKGAVREDPDRPTKSWAEKSWKGKTIVLYCA